MRVLLAEKVSPIIRNSLTIAFILSIASISKNEKVMILNSYYNTYSITFWSRNIGS